MALMALPPGGLLDGLTKNKTRTMLQRSRELIRGASTATYLSELNREQRQAVEHGIGAHDQGLPLLVIAGAGSGKTKTLAHRVAHLIVNGADPRRILLLTFSAPRGGRTCSACPAHFCASFGNAPQAYDGRVDLGRDVPWHRRPVAA